MDFRGVVLAGGRGTRLGELTRTCNKHLLPVGAEPMIYHPLRKLIEAGIVEILLVTGPEHVGDFARCLGSGRHLGCSLTFRVQDEPGGIAQALALAETFCAGRPCAVLLGDNIFADPLGPMLAKFTADRALVVLKEVADPGRYGVAEIRDGDIVSLDEKPARPRSNLAVTGIYAYPADVFALAKGLKPSGRGELEITDLNRRYLEQGRLGYANLAGPWTDAGTPETLAVAQAIVGALQGG